MRAKTRGIMEDHFLDEAFASIVNAAINKSPNISALLSV